MRGGLVGAAVVLAAAIPIITHATRERRAELGELAHLRELAQQLQPVAQRAGEGRRVYINGAPIFFRLQTSLDSPAKALDAVGRECESGDPAIMLGVPTAYERAERPKSLDLTKMIRQDGDGLAAALCVFHEGSAHGENSAQIRYTLAHENEDHRTSLFSISTEQRTDVFSLFPDQGDAPGGDFKGIPRPRGSRRLFAAMIEGDSYAVRIYEQKVPLTDSVKQYDSDMAMAGWVAAPSVVRAMPDARMYTRGDERFVASFEDAADGNADGNARVTRVSIAPFQK